MAKDSKYNKEKEKKEFIKLNEEIKNLPMFCKDFLLSKAKRNTNTALAYAADLAIFFEYLKTYCPLVKDLEIKNYELSVLEELTYRDINEYQDFLSKTHPEMASSDDYCYSNDPRGIQRRMCSLRGLYKYLCSHKEITNDPTLGADPIVIRENNHNIIRMNSEEVGKLLETVQNGVGSSKQKAFLEHTKLRDYAILYLMLNTGIRVSECVGLDVKDINFNENSMVVFRKGKKENILYFDDELADILQKYINEERPSLLGDAEDDALFISKDKTRITARSIQRMLKKYASVAVSNKKITPHKLRSTYGTALYNQTGDIRLVADVLGHSDINVTSKHYAAVDDTRRRKASLIKIYDKDPNNL